MIARIAASHEARPHLAEELVQDIWFAVWRALPAFRGDSSLRSFVARIAGNRAATHVAQAVRAPKSDEVDDSPARPPATTRRPRPSRKTGQDAPARGRARICRWFRARSSP